MLALQEYLQTHTLAELASELSIGVFEHPTEPLVGFKYCQINSPRNHPVVKECRGVVLEKDTWRLIAKPFNRFYNVGEYAEDFKSFDWTNFTCVEKEDGSLIVLYYYNGSWRVNTSGSFGFGQAQHFDDSWEKLFWSSVDFNCGKLHPHNTYIFELCTPYNKVVRTYKRPQVILLGVNYIDDFAYIEFSEERVDLEAQTLEAKRPRYFATNSQAEVAELIRQLDEDSSDLFEGVILRDSKNSRWKWKTASYCAVHHLKDNGMVMLPKRLLTIVLTKEVDEVASNVPEAKKALMEVSLVVHDTIVDIIETFDTYKHLEQKPFAMQVKSHKFAWVFFTLRKLNKEIFVRDVVSIFLTKVDNVANVLFGKKIFQYDFDSQ